MEGEDRLSKKARNRQRDRQTDRRTDGWAIPYPISLTHFIAQIPSLDIALGISLPLPPSVPLHYLPPLLPSLPSPNTNTPIVSLRITSVASAISPRVSHGRNPPPALDRRAAVGSPNHPADSPPQSPRAGSGRRRCPDVTTRGRRRR